MSNELKEILSPEGVEERVELELTFRMTLTGGGKLRTYAIKNGDLVTIGIYTSRKEAEVKLGKYVVIIGSMMVDLEKTMKIVADTIGKKEDD